MRGFNYHSQRLAECVRGAGLNFSKKWRSSMRVIKKEGLALDRMKGGK